MFYCNQFVHGAKRVYSSDRELSFHATVNGWVERRLEIAFLLQVFTIRQDSLLAALSLGWRGNRAVSPPQAVGSLGIDGKRFLADRKDKPLMFNMPMDQVAGGGTGRPNSSLTRGPT